MQVTVTPSRTSVTFPVGSSAPVAEPSVPAKSSTIAAAVPGTPAIATSPSYSTTPSAPVKVAVATLSELTMWIRTGEAAARPRSIANGPTPASRLPQFCRSETVA